MFDFTAQEITPETTREFTFDLIPGRPSLNTAPAHDTNPVFRDARLRDQIAEADRLAKEPRKRPEKQTPESIAKEIEADRERDRRLLADTCARSWGVAPVATDGSRPDLDPDVAYAFFKALPSFMFDSYRNFAQNLYNFVDQPPIDEETADRVGN